MPDKKELPEGACDACWGKGKHSVFAGIIGHEDFGRDGFYIPPRVELRDCSKCEGTGKAKPVAPRWELELTELMAGYPVKFNFSSLTCWVRQQLAEHHCRGCSGIDKPGSCNC